MTAPAFDPWAALHALRQGRPSPPPGAEGAGLGALGGLGGGGVPPRDLASPAAFLARAAEDAVTALAAPDPGLDRERAEVAAAQAAEARGAYGRPKPEAEHRAALAGSLAAGLQRPPAWTDPASLPPPGAWCGCCGRFSTTGGRWWREAVNPTGWRCWTCHPPVHLAPGAVVERQT